MDGDKSPTPPPEGYFSIAPILWTKTKNSYHICKSVVCYLILDAWAYRAKKEVKKELEVVCAQFCWPMCLHNCGL